MYLFFPDSGLSSNTCRILKRSINGVLIQHHNGRHKKQIKKRYASPQSSFYLLPKEGSAFSKEYTDVCLLNIQDARARCIPEQIKLHIHYCLEYIHVCMSLV